MEQNHDEILNKYVTNTDDNVFAIHDLPGIVGAVMARYSRAESGLRETLLREFIKEDKLKLSKAEKLIERVLIAYGDDSVGELEGCHLSFEKISLLATKVIEHRRIGGSPIEQSTRYVRFDFRDENDAFLYYTPESSKDPAHHARYTKDMDRLFENYGVMWRVILPYLKQRKPIEAASYTFKDIEESYADMDSDRRRTNFEKTYENDIKTKACDILRAFLPLATKANVGLFGNGRFFQHLISKLWTSPLQEANILGDKAFAELTKVIPHYVKRARRMDYLADITEKMKDLVGRQFNGLPNRDTGITLIQPDNAYMAERLQQLMAENAGKLDPSAIDQVNLEAMEQDFLASLVFAHGNASFSDIRARLKTMSNGERLAIMDTYYGDRRTRRDRPERGIEMGYPHNFDLVTEWGVYKDLMRHRMGTIQVQPLAPELGFEMPPEMEEAGILDTARETVAIAEDLYSHLDTHQPSEREYAFLQGHKMRWFLGMNDRALMHMVELRTTPQGHPNYRKAAQDIHRLLVARYPERAGRMRFVNHDEIFWSRGDSEARQRDKEDKLDGVD